MRSSLFYPFKKRLEQRGVVILDGGLSGILEQLGADLSGSLWSSKVLLKQPDLLKKVGLLYLKAGADFITSATYQLSFEGMRKLGYSDEQTNDVFLASLKLINEVYEEFVSQGGEPPIRVASLGPYGAILEDASEYRGHYQISADALREFHKSRIDAFIVAAETSQNRFDMFAFETIPSHCEATIISKLMEECDYPFWISFSVKDESKISEGQSIQSVVKDLQRFKNLAAIGFNCFPIEWTTQILRVARAGGSKPIAVYPNAGEYFDENKGCYCGENVSDQDLSMLVKKWQEAGARMIGGGCRMGPEQINVIRHTFLD